MIKKPFFGLGKPKLKYSGIKNIEGKDVKEIPPSTRITLMHKSPSGEPGDLALSIGDEVRTGQKLNLRETGEEYLTSTATGTITDISHTTGYAGQSFISVSIEARSKDQWDDEFEKTGKNAAPENALPFLSCLPGISDLTSLIKIDNPLNTIIINGLDRDLLIATNQIIVRNEAENLAEGIEYLKKITGVSKVIFVVPPSLRMEAEQGGAEVEVIEPLYPDAIPGLLMKKILDNPVPPSQSFEDLGVGFISAEAVVALRTAFVEGKMPVTKVVTVIDKDNRLTCIKARVGTPVSDILNALNIDVSDGDRLVFGGPMSGQGIYSEDMPILRDTDAIMVQDKDQVMPAANDPCINCGECVRVCPAKLPVNMLIRLLENGLYEEAAQEYDLFSCVECGLCSYVCVMRIPIFHYIMLGKHELPLTGGLEKSNG
ncbi:MAG: 4Fe-4S dicluster domain-containing protein [Desulfobacteraceae bacterium]|nr:4Fe-4S dicluster domain-containing protein [Desulfobacteraceae bacterium]